MMDKSVASCPNFSLLFMNPRMNNFTNFMPKDNGTDIFDDIPKLVRSNAIMACQPSRLIIRPKFNPIEQSEALPCLPTQIKSQFPMAPESASQSTEEKNGFLSDGNSQYVKNVGCQTSD